MQNTGNPVSDFLEGFKEQPAQQGAFDLKLIRLMRRYGYRYIAGDDHGRLQVVVPGGSDYYLPHAFRSVFSAAEHLIPDFSFHYRRTYVRRSRSG